MTLDLLTLLLGFVLGVVGALFIVPVLEPLATELLVRAFGRFGPRTKASLQGKWAFVWVDDATPLSRNAECQIEVRELFGRLLAEFEWRGRPYRLQGRVEGGFVTGTYQDRYSGSTYQGAFQLHVDPRSEHMVGRWIGFDRHNAVVGGPWQWRRLDHHYPYERASSTTTDVGSS